MRSSGPTLPIHKKSKKAKGFLPFQQRSFSDFPISIWSVFASFAFWCIIFFLGFKCFQFFGVYRSLNDSDLEGKCTEALHKTVEENMKTVSLYPFGIAKPYIDRIGSQRFTDSLVGTAAPEEMSVLPPIVVAVASSDFFTVQRTIAKIKEAKSKTNIKLIIYDIGLYEKERLILTKFCDCDVRKFDVQIYPEHVSNLQNKAYRPIIIQTIIEEFGSVVWLEPTSVFKNINDINMLKYRGKHHFFLWEEPVFEAITAYTHPKMFEYLGEQRCTYQDLGMIDVRTMIFYRTNETWFSIMKPWLICALNPECIAPVGSRSSECFHYKKPKMTGCHWYDQSVLSIIMNRVYHFNQRQDLYAVPRLTVYDHEEVLYYFPEQPWTYTEIVLYISMPLVVLAALIYLYKRRTLKNNLQYRKR